MNLLVIGSVAFDAIETPFGKRDKIVGGAASFICLSASYFTQNINLVAVVGGDFPKETIKLFQDKGVNTDGLQIKENEKSFFWSGKYHNDLNSRDTLVTELNVLADFDPIIPDSYQKTDILMLGNLTPDIQRTVIERLSTRPKFIVMDTMNFWMDIAWDSLMKTISMVDLLTINDEEARQMSGEYSLVKAAKKIMALGPKYLVIKKGEHGALLFHKDEIFYCPALPLEEVFDPTGAGDTFAGGLVGYLTSQPEINFEALKRAVVHGSAMASYCVEQFGPEALYSLDETKIKERVSQFEKLVKW